MRLSRVMLLLSVTAGISAAATQTWAQEGETWYRVQVVEVRPDKVTDFVELYREEINPALRRGGVPWRSAWRAGEFGNEYERQFITPLSAFSDLDGGDALPRALSQGDYDRVLDTLRETTIARHSYAVRYRQDLSVESDDVSGLSIARVTNVQIATGREGDFEAFLRDNVATFRDAGVVFGIYQRQFGPGPVVWQIVENLRSYGDLARGGILRAFDDQTSAAQQLVGVITSVERYVLEYDPELSFAGVSAPSQ